MALQWKSGVERVLGGFEGITKKKKPQATKKQTGQANTSLEVKKWAEGPLAVQKSSLKKKGVGAVTAVAGTNSRGGCRGEAVLKYGRAKELS